MEDETVCVSHSAYTPEKSMNPTILPPIMGKIVEQTGILNLDMPTRIREGKL